MKPVWSKYDNMATNCWLQNLKEKALQKQLGLKLI